MIDFHSHILPGIDDGSASVEQTLQMLRLLAAQGVDTVVATPHFSALETTPELFLQQRNEAFESLPQEEGLPQILLGAEVAYFNGMSRSQELRQLKVGHSDLLLVEMPFTTWTDRMIEDVCNISGQLALQPVLAHVERYAKRDQLLRYEDVLLENVYFQCNAEAFLKGGKMMKRLSAGNIHFLGTDCHNMGHRKPNMDAAVQMIQKKLGQETVEELKAFMRQALEAK